MGSIGGTFVNSFSHNIDELHYHGLPCSVNSSWPHRPGEPLNIPSMGPIIFRKLSLSVSKLNTGISSWSVEKTLIRFVCKSKILSLENRILCKYLKEVIRFLCKRKLINVSAIRLTSGTAFSLLFSSTRYSSTGKSVEKAVQYISKGESFSREMHRKSKDFWTWCNHDNDDIRSRWHSEIKRVCTRIRPWNASGWIYVRSSLTMCISWKIRLLLFITFQDVGGT